jgi:murein L,D-transpeptidase YafK
MKWLYTLVFLSSVAFAEMHSSNLIQLDHVFSHHVMVVEKSTHTLFLYENNKGKPKLVKTFQIATGKIKGNKQNEGDHKTPEGIYQLGDFYSSDWLKSQYKDQANMYGAGAFTLNYPNEIDRRNGKNGGGIWLHSTDDDSRINKGLDSRGCVVVVDRDLKELAKYIDLQHTPMIITQDHQFVSTSSFEKNKNEIAKAIDDWAQGWKEKDFQKYINQYSEEDFVHPSKGRFHAFKAYKKSLFDRAEKPEVTLENISILKTDHYAVAYMLQKYKSALVNDSGKKVLYLKRNSNYEWKIVSELFYHNTDNLNYAFTPAQRFFKDSTKDNLK